ncbi:extracellular solute-binding protein [Ancylobacter dichloromethanicus]|uniref:ABC transporter n=1 Tax=Ancylobacter dichloromethanicus TaxID=518825 RepID=A0A9W6JBY2_9HYPH|nr:extracellular solute-binding protein [Ancylobacter dichloromethanicus]MBS7553172.1 extracellular solute-binding protein [Ancylobacter dichloromethanicus]GLK72949.1 ABC transporter [Ancylobacter dichloromethanicus]
MKPLQPISAAASTPDIQDGTPRTGISVDRRDVLKTIAAGALVTLAAPYVRPASAAPSQLRALMWEGYLLPDVIAAFEEKHGVKFAPTFFDGNSEAYNKLRVGGTKDFDLVQADGFWPSLYYREKLIRDVDYAKIPATEHLFPVFKPAEFKLLTDAATGVDFGVPFCWGSYGITYNTAEMPADKANSIACLFDPAYAGRLSTSARFEENIALAGILVATRMGTIDKPRPNGKPFNPYDLTDEELAGVEKLLIEQKALLLTRYQDNATLAQLLESGAVIAAPEFAQVYRQLLAKKAKGEIDTTFAHTLVPREGGLGWVDTWLVSSGVPDGAMLDVCQSFIDTMITPETMKKIALASGCSTTIDIRSLSTPEEQALYLMDRTGELSKMYMFDQPSSTEKWERVWSRMQAA